LGRQLILDLDILAKLRKIIKFKSLFINFSTRSFANLFSKLLGLITLPIITRALGPEAYGNYNLVMIVVNYTALPLGLLGLRSYAIREIASGRKDNDYAMEILSLHFTMVVIAVSISLGISYIIFHKNLLLFIAILLSYLMVFVQAFDLEFFYVSQKDLAFPTIAKIVGQLFYVAGVVFLIKKPSDYAVLVFLASLSPLIADLIQVKKYIKHHSKFKINFKIKELWHTFKKTWVLGISQNLEGFLGTIPQLLLPIMLGAYALGIYAGGFKIYSILVLFYVTFFYALAPYLVQLNQKPIKTQKRYHLLIFSITFSASTIIGILLYFFGEPFILLILGKSFGESVVVFKAISLTLIPLLPVTMLLGNILIYSGVEKYYLTGLIVDGLVITVSAPVFIKTFGIVGAVYSLALGMIVTIFVLTFFYFKMVKNAVDKQNVI